MRGLRIVLAAAGAGALLAVSGAPVLAASAPAGGKIVALARTTTPGNASIVVTGAIGDSGTTTSTTASGKRDPRGPYAKVTLGKGSFDVDKSQLQSVIDSVSPEVNTTTCSSAFSVTKPVTVTGGTGLYKGITGTLKATEFVAFVSPHSSNGKCNLNANPTALSGLIVITGTVSFGGGSGSSSSGSVKVSVSRPRLPGSFTVTASGDAGGASTLKVFLNETQPCAATAAGESSGSGDTAELSDAVASGAFTKSKTLTTLVNIHSPLGPGTHSACAYLVSTSGSQTLAAAKASYAVPKPVSGTHY